MEVEVYTYPPRLTIYIEDDFPLESHLEIFESHMFLTAPGSIQRQDRIPDVSFAVGGGSMKSQHHNWYYKYGSLEERKKALSDFNTSLKEHLGRRPVKTDVGCFLITFEDPDDARFYSIMPKWVHGLTKELSNYIIDFSRKYDRVAAITPHFYQQQRYPHFHCLYEKVKGTKDDNLLQDYIKSRINTNK